MVIEGACALIIGQWGVQCSTGVMCNQHAPTADNGIASKIITSAEATSLNRHVMFLKVYYAVGARMGCDPDHSRLYSRLRTCKAAAVSLNLFVSGTCVRRRVPLTLNRSRQRHGLNVPLFRGDFVNRNDQ
jgi:hypothetical protein